MGKNDPSQRLESLAEAQERLDAALARERAAQGSREALLAMLEDLQESQLEVEKARHEWASAMDAMRDPIFMHDSEHRIIRANLAYAAHAGMDIRQVIGKPYWQLFHKGDGPLPACAHEMEQSGAGGIHEEELQLPSGLVFNTRFFTVRDRDGDYLYSLHAMEDITESKRAEQEIRQLNAELEQRVAARTAQLQAINADLESFSYSVSHDLRAPLRAIDGFAAILREDYASVLDDEGKRLLQVVSDNAEKMGRLIDDILALSRAGRAELQMVTLDMHDMAQKVWQELEPRRAGRAIELRLADLPPASGDPIAVHQVLLNLLDNAVKFTRGRTPALIEVEGRREGEESIYSIRDNGAGFDMVYANKLFGLFQRLHGMDEFEGTGVGLAIVERFIKKHGGRVWAEGKAGEGATFWFALPAGTPPQA